MIRIATITLKWQGKQAVQTINQATIRGFRKVAKLYVAELRRLILETPKTGVMYGSHQASAPGEPPASETGRLILSFRVTTELDDVRPKVRVSTQSLYAKYLEYGTSRMAARPFMRPALATIRRDVLKQVGGEVASAIGPRIPTGAPR
jgi:HK97 gp10 family phage protein